jgi:hypothetical protein
MNLKLFPTILSKLSLNVKLKISHERQQDELEVGPRLINYIFFTFLGFKKPNPVCVLSWEQ